MYPDTTTLLVCLHAPVWRMSSKFKPYAGLQNGQSPILNQLFGRFKRVHFLTGHMHYNVNTKPSNFPHISEHNVSSVCGTWWWTSYYNAGRQLCRDGSPAGYNLWEIDGDSLRWHFCSLETPGKWRDQMRIYDMNTVKLFYDTCAIMREVLDYRSGHDDYVQADSNMVMVNVYAYGSGWRLDMLEGDDTPLSWKRVYTQDPLHVISFELPHYRRLHQYSSTSSTHRNFHTFEAHATTADKPVTVRVVDNFGRVYIDRIERPLPFGVWVDRNQKRPALGDINVDGVVDIVDLNIMINIILGTEPCSELMSWLGDFNVDGDIDSADLNAMVDVILGRAVATY